MSNPIEVATRGEIAPRVLPLCVLAALAMTACSSANESSPYSAAGPAGAAATHAIEDARVQEFLDGLYPSESVRRTFVNPAGQTIDCVRGWGFQTQTAEVGWKTSALLGSLTYVGGPYLFVGATQDDYSQISARTEWGRRERPSA